MSLAKNKGGHPDRAFVVGAAFGIIGAIGVALTKPRRVEGSMSVGTSLEGDLTQSEPR